jgi:hypothetical protein
VCGGPLAPITAANRMPRFAGASADFRHLIFESRIALLEGATPGVPNLYESVDGVLRLAGVLPDTACGSPPCIAPRSVAGQGQTFAGGSFTPRVISADGSRIVFTDTSSTGDNTGVLYERVDGSSTLQVNASERTDCADNDPCTGAPEPDPAGAQPATYQTASSDGTRVFFLTPEQLTDDDTDSAADAYMWDANRPDGSHLVLLSVDHELTDTAGKVDGVIGTGTSGDDTYFIAGDQLVADAPLLSGTGHGIYAWHNGPTPQLVYVGELVLGAELDIDQDVLNRWGGVNRDPSSRVSPDGQHLLFASHSGEGLLSAHGGTDYDQAGHSELYVYDAGSDRLACASCHPDGSAATADTFLSVRTGTGAASTTWHLSHPLSDDGRQVFFSTTDALVSDDTNGKSDAYEFDAQTGQVHLISSGHDPDDSYFMDADADGSDAFFLTRQQLVGWDTDANFDLYDARVGGGFPDPPVTPPVCAGEACQGAPGATPSAPPAGSLLFSGPGNVKDVKHKPAPRKCRKGFVRKKVKGRRKCVKKRKVKKGTRASARRRSA